MNTVPTPQDDLFNTTIDTVLLLSVSNDLLANDTDPEGDPLQFLSFTDPANGSLVDNGDGTLSYQPPAGFSGTDTFTYTVSDGDLTETVTVSINVVPEILSDDFNAATLDEAWTQQGPGGTVALESDVGEAYLTLDVPAGTYDPWGATNGALRVMQAAGNNDFELEARFLSTPTRSFQMQGILVEQDADDWLRFDTYHDGSTLHVFAAATVAGKSTAKLDVPVAADAASHLRVTRTGDDWTFDYSADGQTWTTAGTFTQHLNVTAVGPFAGVSGGAPGHTAQVDYFVNTAAPLTAEDAVIAATDDVLVAPGESITLAPEDLLANDTSADGSPLSITDVSQPTHGTLTVAGDGTMSYAAPDGFIGTDSFTYTTTNGSYTDVGTVAVEVARAIESDDFSDATLDPAWTLASAAGSASIETAEAESFLRITVPEGKYDAWGGTNSVVRVMQTATDGDMTVSARFLNTPTVKYQMQGFMVMQDDGNWIRFDTYHDGGGLRLFAAKTENGKSSTMINVPVSVDAAEHLRVSRAGDAWSFDYSADGTTWTQGGSFSHAMTVSDVGLFAGNAGSAKGYAADVDWFVNAARPLSAEDPLVAASDSFSAPTDGTLTIAVDELLANDTAASGQPLTLTDFTQPANGTLSDDGSGALTYTPNAGFVGDDSFTYTATDGTHAGAATVTLTVAPALQSDDFNTDTLADAWTAVPSAGAIDLQSGGGEAWLELTVPDGTHEPWGAANGSVRVMQGATDGDFTVEAGFLSQPSRAYQMQGILVEQDADDWIRFDTFHNGRELHVFAAVTQGGKSTGKIDIPVADGAASHLRVSREGDAWTLEYSADGVSWATAGSFTHALNVTSVGPFAGNTGSSDGFVGEVDYFMDTAAPLTIEDALIADDDEISVAADTANTISVAQDLLANDTAANGTLQLADFTQPTNGTLTDNGDGTLTYQPGGGFTGSDAFTYTVTDGVITSTANVALKVETTLSSDDFWGSDLAPLWALKSADGTMTVANAPGESFMRLDVPTGKHDAWGGTNSVVRAMQETGDQDMSFSARYLSLPSATYQMQGLMVESDANNWIRFDVHHDGRGLKLFSAVTVDGNSTKLISKSVSADAATHLRVTRTGDTWTYEHSGDGVTWTEAGSFTHAMTVSHAGVFAGNAGPSNGYVADIDWFQNEAEPLAIDDPLVAADDSFRAGQDTPLAIAVTQDLLGNDVDALGQPLSLSGFTQPTNGTLTDNGDGTLTYTPAAGFLGDDAFTYTVSNGTEADTAVAAVSVGRLIQSDDFNMVSLDPAWTLQGPGGGADLASRTGEAFLKITVPSDGKYDVWGTTNDAIRLQQTADDEDFSIETGFLTLPGAKHQMQGIMVMQDADDWVRFDVFNDGAGLRLFAGTTTAGSSSARINQSISASDAAFLRVDREGNTWTLFSSPDGTTWTAAGSFNHGMAVSSIGPYAANAGLAAGYTAEVDYFFNGDFPDTRDDLLVAADDRFVMVGGRQLDISLASDLLGNDVHADGDAVSLVSLGQPANGTLVDNGDGTATYTPDAGFLGNDTLTYEIAAGGTTDIGTATIKVSDPIKVWYGAEQSFGTPGEGQEWVNILGNVDTELVTDLAYSLNGGPLRTLSIGADTRRLENDGDFNADPSYDELDGTTADDVITLHATLVDGTTETEDVTVNYESGNRWPANYSIDWASVTNIQDAVQVVDGKWSWNAQGVSIDEPGYDRLLAVGDQSWDNYEVRLSISMDDFVEHGGFSLGMLWNGHTDIHLSDWQPKSGYTPGSHFFYTNANGGTFTTNEYWSFGNVLDTTLYSLTEGKTYNFAVRVEQTNVFDREYKLKVWEDGTPEPDAWLVEAYDAFDTPTTGAFLLNTHHFDVTFEDLTVTELTGSDIIAARPEAETIVAADASAAAPGLGEIDVISGGAGADTFVLGDSTRLYYDDTDPLAQGIGDYALLWDFVQGEDKVQLHGSAAQYSISAAPDGTGGETAIWWIGDGSEQEMVGVVKGAEALTLASEDFFFVTDTTMV